MSEKKYYEEFEKYYANVPDCVCSGIDDYNVILKELFDLTNGLLILHQFEAISDEKRNYTLNLSINNNDYSFHFQGSDYFNQDLLTEFNNIIEKENPNERRRLIEFGNGIDFDFGVAFFERAKEYELAKLGKIWRSEDWIHNYEQNLDKTTEG